MNVTFEHIDIREFLHLYSSDRVSEEYGNAEYGNAEYGNAEYRNAEN